VVLAIEVVAGGLLPALALQEIVHEGASVDDGVL
jgi:hypothetical protein